MGAVSNTHDGVKVLGDDPNATGAMKLQGIAEKSDIGFLTVLEWLRQTQVGFNFKNPKFPIWMIGSSTHYTVCFALDKDVGKLTKADQKSLEIDMAFEASDPNGAGFIQEMTLPAVL